MNVQEKAAALKDVMDSFCRRFRHPYGNRKMPLHGWLQNHNPALIPDLVPSGHSQVLYLATQIRSQSSETAKLKSAEERETVHLYLRGNPTVYLCRVTEIKPKGETEFHIEPEFEKFYAS